MGMKSLDGVVSSIFICVYVLSLGMYMHTCVLVCLCVGWTLMLVAFSLLISSFSFETLHLSLNLAHRFC